MARLTGKQRMALLPVFFVIIFLGSEVINHLMRDRDLAQAVQSRARLVEEINDVVHQLQRERGYSSGYLASQGRYLTAEMARERQITDRVVASVRRHWADRDETLVPADLLQALSKLSTWRSDIDDARVSGPDVLARYTALVNGLLGLTELKSIAVSRDKLPFLIETRQAVSQAKEAAGLQRAIGSMVLGQHSLGADLHRRFLSLSVREDTFLALAYLKAEAAERPLKALRTSQFNAMDAVRQELIAMGYGGAEPNVTAGEWFALSSAWVDRLRAEENRLNAQIAHASLVEWEKARDALILRGLAVVFALLLLAHQLLFHKRAPHHDYQPTHAA